MAEADNVEAAIDMFTSLANEVPFACGTAGFGFSYWHADRFAGDQVRSMLPLYTGFDHSDVGANNMRGRTPSAAWLTFLSNDLMTQVGDPSLLRQLASDPVVYNIDRGVVIRSAKRPIVGDVERGAEDIGLFPSVSR